jgi:hypothetical protein
MHDPMSSTRSANTVMSSLWSTNAHSSYIARGGSVAMARSTPGRVP